MKKLFGELNISWKRIILFAVLSGVIVGLLNSIHPIDNTSLTDPAVYFDLWILFGILIIMNSKSNKEAAFKCFVFFLISQPLIYLVEVPFSHLGWQLFGYYRYWFYWTVFCIFMGFIGYYMKKDKWWGLIILLPMLVILGYSCDIHLGALIYSFPRHLISYLFCVGTILLYPQVIFKNKKIRLAGLIIGLMIIIGFSIIPLLNKPTYETDVLISGNKYIFDDTYKVSFEDTSIGEVSITYIESIQDYSVHTIFYKMGKTKLYLESPEGVIITFDLDVGNNTYEINKEE